ncbi:MAG: UDP-N-acetylglucosamine 1-carboxyvinyltransferase [Lachnospiraceae bacterium]|nr:UDP-N-acetylglucosamine 1-carboxyvinyltransferase [Lachnospiraceae bacterium]
MSKIHIIGGKKLEGSLGIQGSKNAALPVLAATLLTEGINVLENCPQISDVKEMLEILLGLCCDVWEKEGKLFIKAPKKLSNRLDKEHIISMRSSVILLGVLLSENGAVCMEYPGGCVIGKRPIDMHIRGLEKMGCYFEHTKKVLCANTKGLQGAQIYLHFPSVGATENLILAAVKAKGDTVIYGAAKEPEIIHLCEYLNNCGARIKGAGTERIQIEGVLQLSACKYKIPSDRIVAGTYLMCALATRGYVRLKNAPVKEMEAVLKVLNKMGAAVWVEKGELWIDGAVPLRGCFVETGVYPGFPTDLQSPMLVLMSQVMGKGMIKETIYENRFHIVHELHKMKSGMQIAGNEVAVCGPEKLNGAIVRAKELRGNAALVMAGMVANGETTILDCKYVKRGYEDICRDLRSLGAIIDEKED